MSDDTVLSQAQQLEELLPRVIRRLFTLEPDHPVMDMPIAQLRVCTILQSGARAMSQLSEELGITVSAMTQIADRMERAGLVERLTGVEDRRQKRLQLTVHGAEIISSRRRVRVRRAAEALEKLDEDVRLQLLTHLHALLGASVASAPAIPFEDPISIRQET